MRGSWTVESLSKLAEFIITGKNTRFPNGEFSINSQSEEPILGNAWELIKNSKHENLHLGIRWESKTQLWEFSGFL